MNHRINFKTHLTIATVAVTLSLGGISSVQAVNVQFDWTGQVAQFRVIGQFSYDETAIPTDGIVRKDDLDSFSVSFFDPSGNLLRTYVDNHLTYPNFNFNFDTTTGEVLQDGAFTEPTGFDIGEKTPDASAPRGFTGLNFLSRPERSASGNVPPPHLYVIDWAGEFGFPPAFFTGGGEPREDIAFFNRTIQDFLNNNQVGPEYLDDVVGRENELGQRITATQVTTPEPSALLGLSALSLMGLRGRGKIKSPKS
jgi:hypothetical protein